MRARFAAVLGTVVLIAAACQAATPSASAPPAASSAAPASVAPSTAPSAAAESVLRVSRISDFLPDIHPVDLGTGNQELMADILFSTLVDVDKDEVTILPDLATTWTASPDATVYTFNLNPAAVWSDGKPVTADDVEYTIAWGAQNSPTGYKQIPVDMWVNVKGGAAASGTKNIPEGIKKIDAHTVELTLETPGCHLPPADRRRGLLHPAEAHARGHHRRSGADLPVLPRAPSARRSAPAPTTSPSRSRPAARPSPPRRTTGRARTRRSPSSSTRSRSRTSPWRSLRPVSST